MTSEEKFYEGALITTVSQHISLAYNLVPGPPASQSPSLVTAMAPKERLLPMALFTALFDSALPMLCKIPRLGALGKGPAAL